MAVTFAPATDWPVESVTVPTRDVVVAICADPAAARSIDNTNIERERIVICDLCFLSLTWNPFRVLSLLCPRLGETLPQIQCFPTDPPAKTYTCASCRLFPGA